jgi:hypothetical protein
MILLSILVLVGCGLQEEKTAKDANVISNHREVIVNIDSKNKDSFSFFTPSVNNGAVSDMEEEKAFDNEDESVDEAIFLGLLEKYNHMFEERVEPEIDYDNFQLQYGFKFKSITTKEELYEKFSDFMTAEIAGQIWEHFVIVAEDGLYFLPQDGLAKFYQGEPYTLEKINENTYQLFYRHTSELHGIVDMTFTFQKIEGQWKISGYKLQSVFENNVL